MARIFVENDGTIHHLPAGVTTATELSLPVNLAAITGVRPSGAVYGNKLFMAGPWNHPVVVTEDYKVWAMGIQAPQNPPTLAATTSTTSITVSGNVTGYLTFVEKKPNGVWVAESNPSDASDTLTGVTVPFALPISALHFS